MITSYFKTEILTVREQMVPLGSNRLRKIDAMTVIKFLYYTVGDGFYFLKLEVNVFLLFFNDCVFACRDVFIGRLYGLKLKK